MLLSATPTKIYRVVLDVGQGFNSNAVEKGGEKKGGETQFGEKIFVVGRR